MLLLDESRGDKGQVGIMMSDVGCKMCDGNFPLLFFLALISRK